MTTDIRCEACDGTGFPKVKQPAKPGKRIYPAPCKGCGGKGRVRGRRNFLTVSRRNRAVRP